MLRRFRNETSNESLRLAAGSRFSTAWRTRANISAIDMGKKHCDGRHRFAKCSVRAAGRGWNGRHPCRELQPVRIALLADYREDVGGLSMYDETNRMERMEALRLWTVGSSWFSTEDGAKGSIVPGQLADLAVLSADYFSVVDDEIKQLESVLTVVGGKAVYAAEEFETLAPAPPPILPDWSPVAHLGGYAKPAPVPAHAFSHMGTMMKATTRRTHGHKHSECPSTGGFGCLCWAF